MRTILLDTSAYSRLLVGDARVLDALGLADTVFMSVFVLGELHAGFLGGTKRQANEEMLQRFLSKPAVKILNATAETSEIFGTVKDGLRRAGTPLPINDVWIAAHTLETGSVLVSYDDHFRIVPGLRLW
ncbi:MAG: type II toxin-antitoxin system VapC family toxin [Candidatus Riflebacteria bacterium]|nr:type II toxin-antitoxin system VapC family toxin [Candidatus Riflebacteria bacterium]